MPKKGKGAKFLYETSLPYFSMSKPNPEIRIRVVSKHTLQMIINPLKEIPSSDSTWTNTYLSTPTIFLKRAKSLQHSLSRLEHFLLYLAIDDEASKLGITPQAQHRNYFAAVIDRGGMYCYHGPVLADLQEQAEILEFDMNQYRQLYPGGPHTIVTHESCESVTQGVAKRLNS
jgi:hypothetical protein